MLASGAVSHRDARGPFALIQWPESGGARNKAVNRNWHYRSVADRAIQLAWRRMGSLSRVYRGGMTRRSDHGCERRRDRALVDAHGFEGMLELVDSTPSHERPAV